ncbi:MAG TPA: DUF3891 family protein [Terriglobales bacterium]|jgi:hypothetical protein
MILNPRLSSTNETQFQRASSEIIPVWDAILRAQKSQATNWFLVAQPDHAALAGDIARLARSEIFPELNEEIIQAISLHDEGWKAFDNEASVKDRRPLSFLDLNAADLVVAWRDSIDCAGHAGALAALLVSGHFVRIGQLHLELRGKNADVEAFLSDEAARQVKLRPAQSRSAEEIEVLTDFLQFCDLLSLYICCGSREAVEFPQRFKGQGIRLRRDDEVCRIDPRVFGGGGSLGVAARRYPSGVVQVYIPALFA